MPVYEFRCNGCGAKVTLFFRSINGENRGKCDRCGSEDLQKLVSRFAVLRAPVDPRNLDKNRLLDGVDYSNPASMANFFRRMTDEFQDEPNEHMDEIIGRLDHGEPVEHALGLDEHTHDGPSSSDDSGSSED